MTVYKAPIRDILFSAIHLGELEYISTLPGYEEATPDLLQAILEEAAKLGEEVLAPMNREEDINGAKLVNGQAVTPKGWKEAYQSFVDGGWNRLPFSPERGGQGLPRLISTAVQDIWHSSNMAFSLCTLLTQGAIEALESHGSEEQKDTYLPNLITGTWTGTMNLTEPQAGSDLAAVKTRAENKDDHYLIRGQKIFITYGDHDMTENIIHLVLARTPDAPEGVKGISLFIVPKFLKGKDGKWNQRNDVETVSLEHKLGIHGSPTAVLAYGSKDGAVGYLVGEENQGLIYMFTMMNIARHAVGVEGNAVAERAYQQSVAFARERVQGRAIDNPKGDRVTIIEHPDVKRMLILQKCRIEALRSLGLITAAAIDKSSKDPDEKIRRTNEYLADILIPIVKGYGAEIGLENVSLALQIHGGMGYIEETGVAQHYRDQRIIPIYEGTTGIQALDLVGRKLIRDKGESATAVLDYIRNDMGKNIQHAEYQNIDELVIEGLSAVEETIKTILAQSGKDINLPAAICEPYLRLWGTVVCGWQLSRGANVANELNKQHPDDFYLSKIESAKFYFSYEMPKISYLQSVVEKSASHIVGLQNHHFDTPQH